MYIPAAFRVEDPETIFAFVEHHGFAIVVSAEAHEFPVATHLPLMLDRRGSIPKLVGHFAKGNPQAAMADGQRVLAIFNGPHAFISASWHGRPNVVPTWNYVAVHISGTLKLITDRSRLMNAIESITRKYESATSMAEDGSSWSLDGANSEFIEKMLNGITGFEIQIEKLEGCWKLNQHHDADRRRRVIDSLMKSACEDDREIAELMSRASE